MKGGYYSAVSFVTAIALAIVYGQQASLAQTKPNVIVIVADDAGYSDWGFMDGVNGSNPTPTEIPTPNLDALAARGVKFSRAYVGPNCQPTRAALVTGGYQNRIGNENVGNNYYLPTQGFAPKGVPEGLPGTTATIWDRMKAQGYNTAAVGKWHLGSTPDYVDSSGTAVAGNRPEDQGIDEFFGMWHGSRNYTIGGLGSSPEQRLRKTIVDAQGNVTDTNEESSYSGQYFTNVMGDYAIDYIQRQHQSGQPFFLYQSFTAPHTPMHNSPDINDPRIAGLTGIRRQYASMMLTMDKEIGRILERLDDPDGNNDTSDSIADNTLVIFINDNGGADATSSSPNGADNGVLRGGKGDSYEGGIRVPMIVAGAGVNPARYGTTYNKLVHGVDVLPTAVAAAGGSIGAGETKIDGVDLLPFINGTEASNPHEVLVNRWRGRFTVVREDWTLVHQSNGANRNYLLYNLTNDISQTNDVASQNPLVVEELLRDLTDHEAVFDKPRYEILDNTDEATINIFDHFTFKPSAPTIGSGGTTIIGEGGGPGVASSGNGNFEASLVGSGIATFAQVPNWHNIGGAESANFTDTLGTGGSPESDSRGAYFTVDGSTGKMTVANDTGYQIGEAGETFDISLALHKWGSPGNYNGDETLTATLFTTAGSVNGNTQLQDIAVLQSTVFNVTGSWNDESAADFYTSLAGDVGKTVYLALEFNRGTAATSNPVPRIDVVTLTTSGGNSAGSSFTNWSAAGTWFEGGTSNVETMLESDAFAGAVLEFPTVDTYSYTSNNDMVRMTGMEFMLNKIILSGEFAGTTNQSATIQGNVLLFTKDLDGVGPQIAIEAGNTGEANFDYSIDLELMLYDDLTITGDGDTGVTISGDIRDYFEPRGLTKQGSSTVKLTGSNSYQGDTKVEAGVLSTTSAYLEDTADVYLASGATFDLDFAGTDTIDSLFIDGTPQPTGTWGAMGSGASHETPLLSGDGWLLVSTIDVLPGDFNDDGVVNLADYSVWRDNLGSSASTLANDIDGGTVGIAQYNTWKAHFGMSSSSMATHTSAVPEPAALLILAGLLGMQLHRRC